LLGFTFSSKICAMIGIPVNIRRNVFQGLSKGNTRSHLIKATPSRGQEQFAASGRVARSFQTHAGMRVTRALPATTNCSCAAPPIYEMASNRQLLLDAAYRLPNIGGHVSADS